MHKNLIYNEILNDTDTAALQNNTPWKLAIEHAFCQVYSICIMSGLQQLGTTNGDWSISVSSLTLVLSVLGRE